MKPAYPLKENAQPEAPSGAIRSPDEGGSQPPADRKSLSRAAGERIPPGRDARVASREASQGQALRLLVVDDEEAQRRILAEILEAAGYQVETAASLREATCRIEEAGVDLVLTDLKMPGGSGMELLEKVKAADPGVEVVLMTAFSSVETAVEAMRKGAFNYLPKPFQKDDLLTTVAQVRERIHLRRENRRLRHLVSRSFSYENMLGTSPGMLEVFRTIEKVHSNSATVLIRGESGTGKELVARAIHSSGTRREHPFVAISCAAIPETLIESELFGHEKGAFTGALTSKIGRFEEVGVGTLFLDEIGSMRYDLQAKFLRVIQEREFQRIGGGKMLSFQGRIVAATSEDLEELLKDNRFREDLYFRLNVVPIELPPLRERPGDLPLLATHFLKKYSNELGKKLNAFTPELLDALEAYPWPGNVRELENLVQRMVIHADAAAETLEADMVPSSIAGAATGQRRVEGFPSAGRSPMLDEAQVEVPGRGAPEGTGLSGHGDAQGGRQEEGHREGMDTGELRAFRLPPEGVSLAEVEADFIRQALQRSEGRLEPAARLLGITYKTLQYRIKKYGLAEERKGQLAREENIHEPDREHP